MDKIPPNKIRFASDGIKTIMVVPPKSITKAAIKKLEENNFIVIESSKLDDVKLIPTMHAYNDDILFHSAMAAILSTQSANTREAFAMEIAKRFNEKIKK